MFLCVLSNCFFVCFFLIVVLRFVVLLLFCVAVCSVLLFVLCCCFCVATDSIVGLVSFVQHGIGGARHGVGGSKWPTDLVLQ